VNWVKAAHFGGDGELDACFVGLQQLVQVPFLGELHQHVEFFLVLEGAQQLHDVWVEQSFEDDNFAQQHVFVVVLVDQVFRQDLHGVAPLGFLGLDLLHLAVGACVSRADLCRASRRPRSP
jgi:hypothetical protein